MRKEQLHASCKRNALNTHTKLLKLVPLSGAGLLKVVGLCTVMVLRLSLLCLTSSLAKLRECTIGRAEDGPGEDKPQPTASSACAQSMISAIPQDEIDRMIEEVKALDEETLKVSLHPCNVLCSVNTIMA